MSTRKEATTKTVIEVDFRESDLKTNPAPLAALVKLDPDMIPNDVWEYRVAAIMVRNEAYKKEENRACSVADNLSTLADIENFPPEHLGVHWYEGRWVHLFEITVYKDSELDTTHYTVPIDIQKFSIEVISVEARWQNTDRLNQYVKAHFIVDQNAVLIEEERYSRNPKSQPSAGDVLQKEGKRRYVVDTESKGPGKLFGKPFELPGVKYHTGDAKDICFCSFPSWRSWACRSSVKVITKAAPPARKRRSTDKPNYRT